MECVLCLLRLQRLDGEVEANSSWNCTMRGTRSQREREREREEGPNPSQSCVSMFAMDGQPDPLYSSVQ